MRERDAYLPYGGVVYVSKGTKQTYKKAMEKFGLDLKSKIGKENKMIELEKTYISSSMEAQIAEMIGRDTHESKI